jgi:hypothetical protein
MPKPDHDGTPARTAARQAANSASRFPRHPAEPELRVAAPLLTLPRLPTRLQAQRLLRPNLKLKGSRVPRQKSPAPGLDRCGAN